MFIVLKLTKTLVFNFFKKIKLTYLYKISQSSQNSFLSKLTNKIWHLLTLNLNITYFLSFILGILLYYNLNNEPITLSIFLLVYLFSTKIFLQKTLLQKKSTLLTLNNHICLFIVGFIIANIHSLIIYNPQIKQPIINTKLTGLVKNIYKKNDKYIILIQAKSINHLANNKLPHFVKVSSNKKENNILKGDLIKAKVNLYPPSNIFYPSAFDFHKYLYMKRIGATGFFTSNIEIIALKKTIENNDFISNSFAKVQIFFQNYREKILTNTLSLTKKDNRSIIIAFLLGNKNYISNKLYNAYKTSGLSHLLAISGLHVGLVGWLCFLFIRRLILPLAFIFPFFNAKKIAASLAIVYILFYLFLTNFAWSSLRASIMISIIFLAILIDEKYLSLNNIIRAGYIILFTSPFAITEIGFQLSFMASFALIKSYENLKKYNYLQSSLIKTIYNTPIFILLTSLIISITTFPIIAFHFSQIALIAPIANFICIPIMALWIMPLSILYLLISPIINCDFILLLIDFGIDSLNFFAFYFAKLNLIFFVKPFHSTIFLLSISIIILSFYLKKINTFIAISIALLLVLWGSSIFPKHKFTVSPSGKNFIIENEKDIYLLNKKSDKFFLNIYLQNIFLTQISNTKTIPNCDDIGCALTIDKWTVAIINSLQEINLDCSKADIILFTNKKLTATVKLSANSELNSELKLPAKNNYRYKELTIFDNNGKNLYYSLSKKYYLIKSIYEKNNTTDLKIKYRKNEATCQNKIIYTQAIAESIGSFAIEFKPDYLLIKPNHPLAYNRLWNHR